MLIVERSDQQRPKPQHHKRFTTELSNNVYRNNISIEQRRSSLPVGFRYHSISTLERTKSKANSAIGLRSSFYSFRKPGLAASASLSFIINESSRRRWNLESTAARQAESDLFDAVDRSEREESLICEHDGLAKLPSHKG